MKWLLITFMSLLLTACDSTLVFLAGEGWQPDGQALRHVSWQGSMADASSLTTVVARNEGEWQSLWQRVGTAPPAALPIGKMAVAVLLGQRPDDRYRVEIISAAREMHLGRAERLVVKYLERPPAANKPPQAPSFSSPWAIRLTDYTEVSPTFVAVTVPTRR